jgi:hypothetical protein
MSMSMILYGGAPALGAPVPTCSQLQKRNLDERAHFIATSPPRVSKPKADGSKPKKTPWEMASGSGMTYSSAHSTVPGASGTSTYTSNKLSDTYLHQTGLGGTSEQRNGLNQEIRESESPEHAAAKQKAGALCDEYVHPGGGKGAHAECKIFNELTNAVTKGTLRGGTVLLSIDWRSQGNGGIEYSGMPCSDCYKMLCHAANECGIDIHICDYKNEPVVMRKTDCDKAGGHRRLAKLVDGRPTGGRMDVPPGVPPRRIFIA